MVLGVHRQFRGNVTSTLAVVASDACTSTDHDLDEGGCSQQLFQTIALKFKFERPHDNGPYACLLCPRNYAGYV
jgi:hypothetical protein